MLCNIVITLLALGSVANVVSQTVVDLIVADSELSTLGSAVITAGLGEFLSGPGPFTVFAPTNEAFETVDPTILNQLLTPEFNLHLQNLLAFHVVSGNVMSTDLADGLQVETFSTENITVGISADGVVTLTSPLTTGAIVIQPDLIATNGVVHKISTSILVPAFVGRDLVDLLASLPQYSTLLGLVQSAGLEDALRSGTLTVLAPDNAAFEAVPADILDSVTNDVDLLTTVLLYHVIEGVAVSTALMTGPVSTLAGPAVDVVVGADGGITINGVSVAVPDGLALNGVAHGISGVLLPPTSAPVEGPVDVPVDTPVDVPVAAPVEVPTGGGIVEECGLWSFQTGGRRHLTTFFDA